MPSTDRLNFCEEKIFKTICECLQKQDGKTKNIIDCKEDIVFVWDNKERRLLTQNLKILKKDAPVYQELFPTEPPLIDIQFIRVNSTVSKAVLWGPNGLAVMDIPRRWGSQGAFQGGKSVIMTRCKTIEDRCFLINNIEIRQVRFHPGSSKDNHILVLTSDNVFRLYKLPDSEGYVGASDDPELVHIWGLGQTPLNTSGRRMPFLASLGDTAVDFDFTLPVIDEELRGDEELIPEAVVWPAVILRGNGDVCLLNTSLASNEKPKFEGPLTMYPPADDNYGVDACSILVLPTLPNTIVVATSSGTLYHSVLLKSTEEEKSGISNTTQRLYVLESVELELGIQLNDDDPSYTCPVLLHKDPISRWKYYCTHNTGIHGISVGFVLNLEKFVEEKSMENFKLDQSSAVEYLVCTRTNLTPPSPVLGLTMLTSWNIIVALLSNGDVISLPLKMVDVASSTQFITGENVLDEVTPMKKLLKEPFDSRIRALLKRNVNQPIFKLDKNSELTPQEYLDLIGRTTTILRQEYFAKFEIVRDEIEQRVVTLKALKQLQMQELSQLEEEKSYLQDKAEELAEKYEEIKDKQQILAKRVEEILIAVMKMEPVESVAEKKMKNELISIGEKIETYEKSIKQLRDKMEYQRYKIDEHNLEKKREVYLRDNEVTTIKSNLVKTSQEIADLVKLLNVMKKQLNIVDS